MLEPYHAGAARSRLIDLLGKGHEKTRLTREEFDKLSYWIDLLVPHSGSYVEGMSEDDQTKYLGHPAQGLWRKWQEEESRNIGERSREKKRRR